MIIGVLLWYTPTTISTMLQPSYTKVTVVAGQVSDIKLDNNTYFFMYPIEGNQFSISTPTLSAKIYPAIKGSIYFDYDTGLEITVSEVYSDHIVLLVRYGEPSFHC
jgi:hypothetical protein